MLTIKRFWRLLSGNRMLYSGAVLMAALATMSSMLPPLIVKITVDSAINGRPLDAPGYIRRFIDRLGGLPVLTRYLWIGSVAVVGLIALNGVFSYFRSRWTAIASENIAKYLKDTLYNHLQKLPYDYHVKAQTGDLIQRCTSDVETIRRFLAQQLVEMIRTIFILIFSVIIMKDMNGTLTLISMAVIPIVFVFSNIFFQKITNTFKLADEKEGELQTVLQESLTGVRVVRAFGRQKYEVDKFEDKNAAFRVLGMRVTNLLAYFWGLSDLLCYLQMGAVLMVGVHLTIQGKLSLGSLIVFNTYVSMLIFPMRQLGRLLGDMGKMGVSLERVYEIIHTPPETDTLGAVKAPLRGDIVFSHVSFSYDKSQPVLRDLSFAIRAGETIAVLGATGSGKSTIMHLLARLYDYEGSITIGGVELRGIEKEWLRAHIGLVLQEPFLYSKSVMNNIRMARFDAEEGAVFDAARTAFVHDVIEGFEHGYDTPVGERGVTLSGGQKQRVAIARTLIKNSDILIFDDSLSAVDTETDAQIRAALKEKAAGVTTFIISQRIATLMEADRIFVIENGRLADAGAHAELVARDGLYARIWRIQNMLEEDFAQDIDKETGL